MLRIFIIGWIVARFGLDELVRFNRFGRAWCALNAWRYRRVLPLRLREALEHLGPIAIKFGQILSTRRDFMPAAFADELAKLQDAVPPDSENVIAATLNRVYECSHTEIFSEFDFNPVGSASVAQVHRARLASTGQEVAVKILRPNVRVQIARDIKLLTWFANIANFVLKDAKRIKPRGLVDEFARHLSAETNLLREAANCSNIGKNAPPNLLVPQVHWHWCRHDVMVMEFLDGVPVSKIDSLDAPLDREAIAKQGIRLFFTQVFQDNLFHADMHPGNVHINKQGQFVLFDYGIVGQLTDFDREYLLRNFLAFFNRDYRRVAQMHIESGWVPANVDVLAFEAEIRTVCEPIFAQPLKDISFGQFLLQMFQTARNFQLEVQPQLILLQKTLLNVEGMGRELAPNINMWDTAKPVLEQWMERAYHPRQVLATIREQAPDWLALLHDVPLATRAFIRKQAVAPPPPSHNDNRWQLRFWQLLAFVGIGTAAYCLSLLMQ